VEQLNLNPLPGRLLNSIRISTGDLGLQGQGVSFCSFEYAKRVIMCQRIHLIINNKMANNSRLPGKRSSECSKGDKGLCTAKPGFPKLIELDDRGRKRYALLLKGLSADTFLQGFANP
jgi:hypothetical protein